jgi:hypothetical protein
MFAMIIGAAVAFIFVGMPVAIIGLFIMSILDRGRSSPGDLAGRSVSESKVSTGSEDNRAPRLHIRESQPQDSRPVAASAPRDAAAKLDTSSGELLDAPTEDCACDR